jgi:predicted small lipoprotein YifL
MRTPKHQHRKAAVTPLGFLCAMALLGACGHKGALVRPSPKTPTSVSAANTAKTSDGVTH